MSVVTPKAAVTKIIKPQLDIPTSPLEYKRVYNEKIGLTGSVYVRNKIEGKRAIWNGKFFTDRYQFPLHIDQEFLKKMPTNVSLDGILINFSMDYTKPTNWDKLRYIPFDIINSPNKFSQRLNILQRIKSTVIDIPKFHLIKLIESNWETLNKLYEEGNERGLILNRAEELYGTIYEYAFGKTGSGIITELIEGINNYKGLLGKFKCISPKGNLFYLKNDIPDNIRQGYKFTRGICTYKDEGVPDVGDTIYYDTSSFTKVDIPRNPSYLMSSKNY